MAEEFGIDFENHLTVSYYKELRDDDRSSIACPDNYSGMKYSKSPFYVHPGCYDIFEPREGDVVDLLKEENGYTRVQVSESCFEKSHELEMLKEDNYAAWGNPGVASTWYIFKRNNIKKIIQRDNKQFFMPEVNDE